MRLFLAIFPFIATAAPALAQDDQVSSASIKFFEGPWSAPEKKARVYASEFVKSKTRYVYVELTGTNDLYRKRIQNLSLTYKFFKPDGSAFRTYEDSLAVPPEWPAFYTAGLAGWTRAGRWPGGAYRVEVFVNGAKKLAEGTFTIADDVANRPGLAATPADNVRIARERFAIEDEDGAFLFILGALGQDPSFAEAFEARASFRLDLGQHARALEDATKAIELAPTRPESYHTRALAHAGLGMSAQALLDYNRAIELNPTKAAYFRNRGLAKYRLEDYDGALTDVEKCLKLDPSSADAFNDRGRLHKRVGRDAEAIEDYTRALRINEFHSYALFNRGTVHLKRGARYQARLDFEAAIRNGGVSIRASAAESLGDVGLTDSADILAGLLWDDDETVRRKAVWTMGRLRAKVYAAEVARLLKDESVDVRRAAAFAVGQVAGRDHVADLEALLQDEDGVVKAHALFSLAKLGEKSHAAQAKTLIQDSDSHVRGDAVEALGFFGDPANAAIVAPFLKSEDPDERLRAISALGRMGARDQAPAIAALLDDPEMGTLYHDDTADWKDSVVSDLAARTLRDWEMDPGSLRPKRAAGARREIGGVYTIRLESAEGKHWGELTVGPVSAEGRFEVAGHEWSGRGVVTGDRGYFDWRRLDGSSGRATFAVDGDGKLKGRWAGSGYDLKIFLIKK